VGGSRRCNIAGMIVMTSMAGVIVSGSSMRVSFCLMSAASLRILPMGSPVAFAAARSSVAVHIAHGAGLAAVVATLATLSALPQHTGFIDGGHRLEARRVCRNLRRFRLGIGRVVRLGIGCGGKSEGQGEGQETDHGNRGMMNAGNLEQPP